jgi:hypothetical protein
MQPHHPCTTVKHPAWHHERMSTRKVKRPRAGRHPNQDPAPPPPRPETPAAWLIAADTVALVVFVLAGMRSHHEGSAVWILGRNAIPLLVAWFAVAALLKTYRTPGFMIVAKTWIVAVPIGLTVRSLWVGSPTGWRFVVFLAVGLGFTMLFLVIGRLLLALITGRGYPQRRRT